MSPMIQRQGELMININELMIFFTRLFFTLLAILTLSDFLRHRDQTRLNIALIFGSLTFTLLASVIDDIVPVQGRWLSTLSTLALAAQPYLLMRVVYRFQRVPLIVSRTALVGLLASWVLLIIYLPRLPLIATTAILAYILFVDGYATASFIQG